MTPQNPFGRLLADINIAAVVCNQWGDTGKGKFVDLLASWADIVVRGTGGANAGHTIRAGLKKLIQHLIPSSILHDAQGKISVIGSGVAFDPRVACNELDALDKEGLSYNHLAIANNAHLILPQHIVMDKLKETIDRTKKIGTTQRGIGPCYTDHYARIGLKVNDLLNPDVIQRKLKRNLADKIRLLSHKGVDPERIREIMKHELLENGIYYTPSKFFDTGAIIERYREYGKRLHDMIQDTDVLVQEAVRTSKRILLEGAQGLGLDIDKGTYPFVTSSNTSIDGLARGAGLPRYVAVDLVIGILKAFFMTRVGEGAFPTELGGEESRKHCDAKGMTKDTELKLYPDASVNHSNELRQGIGIRLAGDEYGATTGRPRRVGWLDLPFARYAKQFNGPNVALSKVDVLDDCDTIKICNAYKYQGPDYHVGGHMLRAGDRITLTIPDPDVLQYCRPTYKSFTGWKQRIADIQSTEQLPTNLKSILAYVKREAGINIVMIGIGPEREQVIVANT